MTEQPETLRLADVLDAPDEHYPGNFDTPKRANAMLTGLAQDAAAELRRLHAENKQLLEQNTELDQKLAEYERALEMAGKTLRKLQLIECQRCGKFIDV